MHIQFCLSYSRFLYKQPIISYSGQDESVTHYGQVNVAVETLCFFTAYMADDRHNLPKDTVSALQHRVDPNIGQRERKTVEVMLYTSGN